MKEARPVPVEVKYAALFKQLMAMNAVKSVQVKGGKLYVCTKPNTLRYATKVEGYSKYLPQIIITIELGSTGLFKFKYRWGDFLAKRYQHPSSRWQSRLNNKYAHCYGDYNYEFQTEMRKGNVAGAVEILIQALQVMY